MKVWILKWQVFSPPNGRNLELQRFFSNEKKATDYATNLQKCASVCGFEIAHIIDLVEAE